MKILAATFALAFALALALAACDADHLVGENLPDLAVAPDAAPPDLLAPPAGADGPIGNCETVADCQLIFTGCAADTPHCQCHALSINAPLPTCNGDLIECFADSCQFETLSCTNHLCAMSP